ncbi:hypothetical protein HaLaN_32267, partial [Haematococcus lacustris]
AAAEAVAAAPPPASTDQPLAAMNRRVQERVLHDIEAAYSRGLAQTGRTTGLGS